MDVGLDFHGRVHRPLAKQLAKVLEPLGLLFIEEPLLSENMSALPEISAHTTTPIALGERLYSRWEFKPFFEQGVVDIIQPDLSHAGGILEVRKIAAMAEAYDVAVAPHCPLGPLALAACLQIAACTPNHAIQEISLGIHYNTGGHDLLNFCLNKEALTPVDGYLPVPPGPGLGIEIDEPAVRAADKERHRWRNPISGPRTAVSRSGNFSARQWHLKRSNGSRQALHRHCALHGVAPKRLTSTVSLDPHCGHSAVADGLGGAMP